MTYVLAVGRTKRLPIAKLDQMRYQPDREVRTWCGERARGSRYELILGADGRRSRFVNDFVGAPCSPFSGHRTHYRTGTLGSSALSALFKEEWGKKPLNEGVLREAVLSIDAATAEETDFQLPVLGC